MVLIKDIANDSDNIEESKHQWHYQNFWKLWHITIPYLFSFLNQARVGLQPALTWFLKIDPVWIVGMRVSVCVCVRAQGY